MRAAAAITGALVVLAALTGCVAPAPTPTPASTPDGVPTPRPTEMAGDPTVLVGQWRVQGAEDTSADTWLRLGAGLDVWSDCGHASGSWRAAGTYLVASVSGSSNGPACLDEYGPGDPGASLRWLNTAASYEVGPAAISLLDRSGTVVAMLVDDGSNPPAHPNPLDEGRPQLTPEIAATLAPPAVLPSDVATATELVGRWLPDDRTDASASAELVIGEDGFWTGSDGCNGTRGRWLHGEHGLLLATGGFSTMMGCENSNVLGWMVSAARVGMLGDDLVLFDADGVELGTLVRG